MVQRIIIKKNRYIDSVSLMSITAAAKTMDGVAVSNVSMGTAANKEIISNLGFEIPEDAGQNDLIIAIGSESEEIAESAVKEIEELLNAGKRNSDEKTYASLDEIDLDTDQYDIVQISLPGEYAAREAEKALEKGLDVFMFSDNVPISDEIRLKEMAIERGRLMMGPDCGVAFLNGIALAVGSTYKSGPIGIVGASGSGAQEVGCIAEKLGYGISSLIGTGGRDLYTEVHGMMMKEGIRRLEKDADTKVIILVSKLADTDVMEEVLSFADTADKPVVAVFLGAPEDMYQNHKVHGAHSLEGAAAEAVRILSGKEKHFGISDEELRELVRTQTENYRPEQVYFRGLYCGGTFAEEALLYFDRNLSGIKLHSNIKTRYAAQLKSSLVSEGHSLLDLGSEEFTLSAPHPVFEPEIRLKRFREEIEDDSVAVILMDFITGPGVAEDPLGDFIEDAKRAVTEKHITIVSNICGSQEDPQDVAKIADRLRTAGVIVTESNYQSVRVAGALISALKERA